MVIDVKYKTIRTVAIEVDDKYKGLLCDEAFSAIEIDQLIDNLIRDIEKDNEIPDDAEIRAAFDAESGDVLFEE